MTTPFDAFVKTSKRIKSVVLFEHLALIRDLLAAGVSRADIARHLSSVTGCKIERSVLQDFIYKIYKSTSKNGESRPDLPLPIARRLATLDHLSRLANEVARRQVLHRQPPVSANTAKTAPNAMSADSSRAKTSLTNEFVNQALEREQAGLADPGVAVIRSLMTE